MYRLVLSHSYINNYSNDVQFFYHMYCITSVHKSELFPVKWIDLYCSYILHFGGERCNELICPGDNCMLIGVILHSVVDDCVGIICPGVATLNHALKQTPCETFCILHHYL